MSLDRICSSFTILPHDKKVNGRELGATDPQFIFFYDLDTADVPVRKWTELENVRQYYEFFRDRNDEF